MVDAAELTALYERYGYLVRRRCRALVSQDAEADDAMQEVFLRVQRYGLPKDAGATLGWLYRIAQNVVVDQARARRELPLSDEQAKRAERKGEGSAASSDTRAIVSAVLRDVDTRTREIVVRHHLDGFTQDEVAAQLKTSRRTVGKRLVDFEERLKRAWAGRLGP